MSQVLKTWLIVKDFNYTVDAIATYYSSSPAGEITLGFPKRDRVLEAIASNQNFEIIKDQRYLCTVDIKNGKVVVLERDALTGTKIPSVVNEHLDSDDPPIAYMTNPNSIIQILPANEDTPPTGAQLKIIGGTPYECNIIMSKALEHCDLRIVHVPVLLEKALQKIPGTCPILQLNRLVQTSIGKFVKETADFQVSNPKGKVLVNKGSYIVRGHQCSEVTKQPINAKRK